ncbi:MAG: exonuclease SbcCD subunit D [Treponema sp.]|nr:exonuclease SbcCD subunit D [Treponema sp.]
MIKFLHTADLHIGKVFHEQSLCEDQAAVLDQLACLLKDDSYSALVIAGDVYDRSIPSPDAVEILGAFLGKVKRANPSLEIFIIPGNHDSAVRLGFGRELFAALGVRLGVTAADCDKPVIIEKNGERCAFFLLPFLNPGVLQPEACDEEIFSQAHEPLRSQSALAAEAGRRMEKALRALAAQGVSRAVLAAHVFASGGAESGGERVFLGSAELVNLSLFPGFDYIALGHLHRCQRVGENAWYSGSPLVYSFGEVQSAEQALAEQALAELDVAEGAAARKKSGEKFFLSVELKDGGAEVEKIPVKPVRSALSFAGPFARFAGELSADNAADRELLAAKDDYLEIRLTDRGIVENAQERLRKRFPRLLSLRQDDARAGLSSGLATVFAAARHRERRSLAADFKDFLASLYGETDESGGSGGANGAGSVGYTQEEIALFEALLAEAEGEQNESLDCKSRDLQSLDLQSREGGVLF